MNNIERLSPGIQPRTFIINGYAQSGKDTFVEMVREEVAELTYVVNVSSIGEIRQIATRYFGWDGITKDTRWRQLLSDLKNLQTQHCDGPFKFMEKHILENSGLLFLHIRETPEIDRFKTKYPEIITILVKRNGYQKDVVGDVEDYNYDLIIRNDGSLDDLGKNVKTFVNFLNYI